MSHVDRLTRWFRRWRAARSLGLCFTRQRDMQCPTVIVRGGRKWEINYPRSQPAVHSDFVNLVLDDDYGVHGLPQNKIVVVDIGANVGLFSFWTGFNNPEAIIHAYEPNPAVLPYLQENLKPFNAHVHPCGVGGSCGTATLGTCDIITLQTVQLHNGTGNVEIESLSNVIAKAGGFVNVLKMDCEGFEWEIFKDVSAFQQIGEIRMEYHLTNGRTIDDVWAAARTINFEITHLQENCGFGIAWLKSRHLGFKRR